MMTVRFVAPQLHGAHVKVEIAFPPRYTRLYPPFSALILNDAQNHWTNRGAYGGWHTDRIAAELFQQGRIRPVILIGVYSPPDRDRVFAAPPQGAADRFTDFLADSVLPVLRRRLPISKNPADIGIVGASYGSNVSIFAGLHRPDAIGMAAGLSGAPHMGKPLPTLLAERDRLPYRKLYIDCGTKFAYDQPHMDDATEFNRTLMNIAGARMPKGKFLGIVAQGHFHNEEFWRKRIGRVLEFFYRSR